jgi:hypothetical protein
MINTTPTTTPAMMAIPIPPDDVPDVVDLVGSIRFGPDQVPMITSKT